MRKRWWSAWGGEAQKRKKQKGEISKLLPLTSAQVMENILDKGPNPSLQVLDENNNWQRGNTADIKRQRDLSHSSETESKGLKLITYSRRSKKVGHNGKKKNQNSSNENFQKNDSHNNNLSTVKSAETGFWSKKNIDAYFGKQEGFVREGGQAGLASMVATDSDSNKAKTLGSEINKGVRWIGRTKRKNKTSIHAEQLSISEKGVSVSLETENIVRWIGRRKRKNKVSIHAEQLSVSEKRVSVSVESENIDSAKNVHPEIPSKSELKKMNNIKQKMLAKEESNGLQRNSSMIAVNKSDLCHSPRHSLKIPMLKFTYSKRCKNSRQQGKGPHKSSYFNSHDNENDICNRSLFIVDAAEGGCKRVENDNSSFNENLLHAEKDGGSSMKNMQTSTNHICSDINSNFCLVNGVHPERIKKPRRRRNKKNKGHICRSSLPISEDITGSVKSEIIAAVERSDLDPEICSKSEMGNAKPKFGRTYAKRKNRATKGTATVNKNGSLDSAQLCDVFPKLLEPKNEDLCQLEGEIPIAERSNSKDGERCPYSLVQCIRDDVMSDTTMKENIMLDNMAMPLQRPTISYGKKKLIILDLNGLLVDVVCERHPFQIAPIKVSGKSVYKRPFCEDFLEFCFERFDVGVWSSRQRKNIDVVVNFLFGEKRSRLLFCWDLSKCTPTGFKTLENMHKPLVLKELKKLWNKEDEDLPWEKGDYSPSNTLLIDDSPYKALCNPPHTAIFPSPYDHRNENDYALGLGGDLRVYLEGLAIADNVQSYVKEHPFGQHAIMPGNPHWGFYLRIIGGSTLAEQQFF